MHLGSSRKRASNAGHGAEVAAEVLVVACVDESLMPEVVFALGQLHSSGEYDMLAGGNAQDGFDDIRFSHISRKIAEARCLFDLKRVMVVSHWGRGAATADFDVQLTTHMRYLERCEDEIETCAPGLEIHLMLIDGDGGIVNLA